MFGFSLRHPMDVLTIPTAYQKKTNKQRNKMIYLSVGVSSLKKNNNKSKGFKFSYTYHAGAFLYGISS